MPIYEYQCRACGEIFEELVRGERDEAELACPKCAGRELARCLSACAGHVSGDAGAPAAQPSASGCGGATGGSRFT